MSQKHHKAAWKAEIDRRVQDILSGKVKGIPAEEVFARIDRKLALKRAKSHKSV